MPWRTCGSGTLHGECALGGVYRLTREQRKPRDPSVSRGCGASDLAVTVGFEPISWSGPVDVSNALLGKMAESTHICTHPRAAANRRSVTAVLPLEAPAAAVAQPAYGLTGIAAKLCRCSLGSGPAT